MKYKIVEIEELTGNEATIYSIILNDEDKTLFEKFVEENIISFKDEIKSILVRLETIGKETGAREIYFKFKEGKPGDGVVALYDEPDSNLRLYCIRYGTQIIILGGGGYKPKEISAFQEDDKLKAENYLLRTISKEITDRIKDKRIEFSSFGQELEGELEFEDEIFLIKSRFTVNKQNSVVSLIIYAKTDNK